MGFAVLRDDVPVPTVERNVEMPEARAGNRWRRRYPWKELEIGDSFLVQKAQRKFGNAIWNAEQRYSIKLSTRSVMLNGVPHTRVWRIA